MEDIDNIMGVDMDIRPEPAESDDQRMDLCMSDADILSADLRKVQLEQNDGIDPVEGTSYLVNEGVPKEAEKLEWTRDTSSNTEGQQELEAAMRKCVEELGEIGRRRFDLNGNMLTTEQVQNLPTHLGLHHHGSNPSDAGYTLTEILLLTRSTVHTQRAMAYTVFSRVVKKQRELVTGPLLNSGALPLAFANLKQMNSSGPNPAAAAAQLIAAEALLKPLHDVGVRELSQDVYFASLFYSPCALTKSMPALKILQASDLVPSLITFAHSWFMNTQQDFTVRALRAARTLVKSCDVTSGKELVSKTNLNHLHNMANGSGNSTSLVIFLACDILAYYLLFVGWGEMQESEAGSFLFRDRNLKSIGVCMQFYLSLPQNVSDEVHLASAASLRVLRAALTFDKGIDVFRENLSAICAVSFAFQNNASEGNTTASSVASREALLALESYVHALYSTANRLQTDSETTSTSNPTNTTTKSTSGSLRERQNEARYAEITALVPLARSAAYQFVQGGLSSHQAAAGHFAGSVFSLHRDPISSDLIPSVLQLAKKASEDLSKFSSSQHGTSASFAYYQQIASCAHAAGRMLSKCVLPESVVGQICRDLVSGTEFEGDHQRRQGQPFIRPIANAAAEWLVKFAQLRPNREAVFRGVQLLPHLGEPQVVMELVFKCIVHPPLLEVLNARVTRSSANLILDKLTTPTLTKLLNEQSLRCRGEVEKGKATLVTFSDIVQWWVSSTDTVEEGALVAGTLVKSDLVSPGSIYRALLHASPMSFVTGSLLSELVLTSGTRTFRDKNLAFHPNWNTCVSIYSAEKRPPLAEIFFQLASRLTERGPFVCINGKTDEDALASLILTTMCRRDAHVSLRQHLWRETVRDCGGGALFAYARFLGGITLLKMKTMRTKCWQFTAKHFQVGCCLVNDVRRCYSKSSALVYVFGFRRQRTCIHWSLLFHARLDAGKKLKKP